MQKSKSVAYKMLQSVVLLTLILGVFIGGVQIYLDYQRHVRDFDMRVEEVLNSIETAATKATYTFDNDLALEVASGLMEFQPIVQVIILDENEREMINMSRYRGDLPYPALSNLLFDAYQEKRVSLGLKYDYERPIGTLRVTISSHYMAGDFLRNTGFILLTNLIQSFVISAFILLLFFRQISVPLRSLAKGFQHIDPEKPEDKQLFVKDTYRQREFLQVVEAGNQLLRVIGQHLQEKEETKRDVLRQKAQTDQYLEIAEAIILELDENANVTMINQRGLDVLGYKRDEILGANWLEIAVPLTSLTITQETFRRIVRFKPVDRGVGYFEGEVCTKTGQVRWIFWHAIVRRDEEGRVVAIVCSGQDLTKRKEAEEALREAEQRLRTIIETTHEGFAIIDRQTNNIVDINTAWHQMMGYSREEILDQNLYDLVDPADHHVTRHSLSLAQNHLHYHFQVRLKKKDGTVLYSEANASLLGDDASERDLNVLFFSDLTKRREQEQSQRQLEKQLQQAQKLETLGTLAGGIAHDFNNVLTPIVGYCALLLDQLPQGDKNRDRIEQISQAANRGQQMIKHILTFSRRSEGERMNINILPVIQEAFDLVQSTLPANIEFTLETPDTEIPVLADSTQIQQVMLNLSTNAIHAMPEGGQLKICISTHSANLPSKTLMTNLGSGPYVRLSVSDTGTGMNEEVLAQIFDPFYTTKKKGEGTGLGLAMVHGIVTGHKGDIVVKSAPTEGTTFDIYLPLASRPAQQALPSSEILSGNGEHILILDDELSNTKFLQDFLTQSGYEVTCFNHSREAWEVVAQDTSQYQLILTDQTMPHLAGDEFVRKVRSLDDELPIIMMSGYDKDMTEEKALDAGVDIYLQKPIKIDQLSIAIQGLIG